MPRAASTAYSGVTHVLLDFFGTLVDYSRSPADQEFHRSHALVCSMGRAVTYERFVHEWSLAQWRLDARSDLDDSEYSMLEVSGAVLHSLLGRWATRPDVGELADTYLGEWNAGVSYPAATNEVLDLLAPKYRLAVVSNTNQSDLVLHHLKAMGSLDYFDTVVTSIDVGWRKPHPAIYAEALRRLGITADQALFVGDDYRADYAGPRAAGMTALLIHDVAREGVPDQHRLKNLRQLPARLGLAAAGVSRSS